MPTKTDTPTLGALLPDDFALGEPDCVGPLAVFPVHAAPGTCEYLSFAEASAHGCRVHELEPPTVGDVVIDNPLDLPVLLFEGEEIRGAQQDRTVDVTILVPARSRMKVAVSCVEAGRWDGTRSREAFEPSAQAAFPALRAAKNRRVRDALVAGLDARADQAEVWHALDEKAERMSGASPTGAMGDIYVARAEHVAELEASVTRRDGQVGALACLGGRPVVLDYVSRPDAFAALWQPLVRGYCLDALEHEAAVGPLDPAGWLDAVRTDWLDALRAARPRGSRSAGLGTTITFDTPAVGGAGLAVEDRLVQLSAFAADGDARSARRIVRPSRRR